MVRLLKRDIRGRTSGNFGVRTTFMVIASFPAVWVVIRHKDRVGTDALQWLLWVKRCLASL